MRIKRHWNNIRAAVQTATRRMKNPKPVSILVPVPDVPMQLVEKLQGLIKREVAKTGNEKRAYRVLGKMKNIDHRQKYASTRLEPSESTSWWGRRVREPKIKRQFPGVSIAIKRVHGNNTAQEQISYLCEKVRKHNAKYPKTMYLLLEPKAKAIGRDLLVMPKIDAPSVEEIIGSGDDITARGNAFFNRVEKATGTNKKQIGEASSYIFDATGIHHSNLLFLGIQNKKLVFMPLLDLA